jgi:hypothetical protein|nr:MAG TPA: hypothetical protein [Caudoviricetes sp.]
MQKNNSLIHTHDIPIRFSILFPTLYIKNALTLLIVHITSCNKMQQLHGKYAPSDINYLYIYAEVLENAFANLA